MKGSTSANKRGNAASRCICNACNIQGSLAHVCCVAGNAVEWAVRRLDASLDEAELDPPPGAKAIIDVVRGPVGSATVQGVTAAARVTVKVGTTALKASPPQQQRIPPHV